MRPNQRARIYDVIGITTAHEGHRAMKRLLNMALLAGLVTSCGISTSKSAFSVRMHGIHSPPAGAEGTSTPRSQIYLFKGVKLVTTDDTEIQLYEGDPAPVKIIDRGQLIFEKPDMSDYEGTTISSVTVQFDPNVSVTSKNNKTTNLELSSGDIILTEDFTIKKNAEQFVTIKAAWGNTISTDNDGNDVASAPAFTVTYDGGE